MAQSKGSTTRIILGLMNFGPDSSNGARITSLDDFNNILDYFQDQGYNDIDTARLYVAGKQENFTAQAHWQERGLKVATKWYPYYPGAHRPEALRAKLEESLTELGTNCIDTFYLHAPDRSVPFSETLKTLDELYKEGKFKQLGLSNFASFEVAEIMMTCQVNSWIRPTIYQGAYNAITRNIDSELIPACRRYGLDIVIYNPLAGGFFSGKYKPSEIPLEGRYSDATGGLGAQYRGRYFKDAYFESLSILNPVVQKHGLTLIEVALRWLVHHSALSIREGKDGIILGISSLSQLKSNLADLQKGPLPGDVVQALDEAWGLCKPTATDYWYFDLKYGYDTTNHLFGTENSP